MPLENCQELSDIRSRGGASVTLRVFSPTWKESAKQTGTASLGQREVKIDFVWALSPSKWLFEWRFLFGVTAVCSINRGAKTVLATEWLWTLLQICISDPFHLKCGSWYHFKLISKVNENSKVLKTQLFGVFTTGSGVFGSGNTPFPAVAAPWELIFTLLISLLKNQLF